MTGSGADSWKTPTCVANRMHDGVVSSLDHAVDRLHRIRWGLLAAVMVVVIVSRDEWQWWDSLAGPLAFAGFWVPWLVGRGHDWTPSAIRARREAPRERARIEAARRELRRHRHAAD